MQLITAGGLVVVMLLFSGFSIAESENELGLYVYEGVGADWVKSSETAKIGGSLFGLAAKELGGRAVALYGFSNLSAGDIYYAIYRDMQIRSFNLTSKEYLGGWPLTRWLHLQRVHEILADHRNAGLREWRERIEYTAHNPYSGCLNQHPLRYGDLEDDGDNELVLMLNGELIVFSPKYERIVFSAFVEASDWFREPGEDVSQESDVEDGLSYQYLSEHLLYNGIRHKAHRSYTKVYTGDYDEDGNPDILTWQKVYAANKVGEAAGFHLIRNELRHFERDLAAQKETQQGVTGEYLPQGTQDGVVHQWLAEQGLTWRKGYPSASECDGQGGLLIPEFHDPLLNDPHVLQ